MDLSLSPLEWRRILVVSVQEKIDRISNVPGGVKLAPVKARRVRMLNQISIWFSQEA